MTLFSATPEIARRTIFFHVSPFGRYFGFRGELESKIGIKIMLASVNRRKTISFAPKPSKDKIFAPTILTPQIDVDNKGKTKTNFNYY